MDTIADFFVRIKNGYRSGAETVAVPFSKMKAEISRVLESRGYVGGSEKKGRKARKFLEVTLRYDDKTPALTSIRRISKASRRLYVKRDTLRPVRQGFGMLIISTSKGLMSGEEARKAGLGGEIIGEVW